MATHRYEVQTCPRCDRPISCSENLRDRMTVEPRMGVAVDIGYSEGGWGYRRNHVNYAAEVCRDCYGEIIAVCRPVIEFLSRTPKRRGDYVQPVQCDELEPERRTPPLLR
jgi:hypothetical protein